MSVFNRSSSSQKPDHYNVGAGKTSNFARPNIQAPFDETGTVIGVNFKLLHAGLLAVVAWWLWPSDPKWWGLGMFSVILWAATIAFVIDAIRSTIKLHAAKKRWNALQALGNAPKNARLAGKHDLQNGGMN